MTDLQPAPFATARAAGSEPLPGYRLLSPLGRGGFGEVWKCEAPGGLFKAIKFVPGGDDGFRQEARAFEQIKGIRHPFLLTLERVEVVGGDLVMVMELADGQLNDRYKQCAAGGAAGIPRPELLGYVLEAAEALDMIGSQYGLQHLDVKPPNIFVVSGHAKVGDYGLVRPAERSGRNAEGGGFTPKYTPPEVLLGKVDIRSDQYSLALVYAELLTGQFPYQARTAGQFLMQHAQGTPDLSALPAADRPAVGRALSKLPAERFPSCLAFVSELITARPGRTPAVPQPATRSAALDMTTPSRPPAASTHRTAASPLLAGLTMPALRTAGKRSSVLLVPPDRTTPPPVAHQITPADPFADLAPVMPADRLHAPPPRVEPDADLPTPQQLAEAVFAHAGESPAAGGLANASGERAEFFVSVPPHMLAPKLAVVAERWGLRVKSKDGERVVMRKEYTDPPERPGLPSYSKSGFEVLIELPRPPAERVAVSVRFIGSPDPAFVRSARSLFPALFEHVRSLVQSVPERRQHPRRRLDTPVRVFPLYTDGRVGRGCDGRLVDVSGGGVRVVLPAAPDSDRVFVQFPDVPGVNHLAVYLRVLRTGPAPDGKGVVVGARFRTEK